MSAMDPQTIIAKRIAQELRSGMLVNLGIGIPHWLPTTSPLMSMCFSNQKTV